MRDFLRARLRQGTATLRYPDPDLRLAERFRGRPIPVVQVRSAVAARPPAPGDGALVDLGQCLFSPEEDARRGGPLEFTTDHRLAASSRDGLRVHAGEAPRVEALRGRMRSLLGRSLRLRSVSAGSCNGCEAELVALSNVVFDLARFGIQFVASPRHADGLLVTGAVSVNMREALLATYAAVPEPRIVIAAGACAIGGGPFRGSPEVSNGVSDLLPVDLFVPGCPPHPLTILDGLLRLLGRVSRSTPARHEGRDPEGASSA